MPRKSLMVLHAVLVSLYALLRLHFFSSRANSPTMQHLCISARSFMSASFLIVTDGSDGFLNVWSCCSVHFFLSVSLCRR